MRKNALLQRFDGFVKNLSATDRIGLMVHCDADGLMSGAIAARAILKLREKKPEVFFCSGYPNHEGLQKKIDILQNGRCNKVLVMDLSLDQDDFLVHSLESFADVLFIDHHKVYNDLNSEKTVFIKAGKLVPKSFDSSKYPASKMVYDLFSRVVDLSDIGWLAAIGVYADCAWDSWKKFCVSQVKKVKSSKEEIQSVCRIIDAVGVIDNAKFSDLYLEFVNADHPRVILESSFAGLAADLDAEMTYWLSEFDKKGELFSKIDLVWFVFNPRFAIKSPFINALSFDRYPNKTVVVVQLLDGQKTANFSGRRQDGKVAINDLFEEAIKGISNASAGGHAPAAAGKVPRDDLDKFKQNLIAILTKKKQK